MNKHIALLAAAGLMALAPLAWAQGPGGPGGGPARQVAVRVRDAGCGGPGRTVIIRRMAWRGGMQREGGWGRRGGMAKRAGMRAGRMGPMGRMGMMAHWSMLKRRLGLTAEQAQKLSDAFFTWQKTRIMDRANQQVRRLEVARLMMAAQPDEAAIDHQLARIEQQRLASAQAGVHFRLTMRRVLTPEQWRRLQAMHARMMMRMHHGMGGMGGGRMPPNKPMAHKPMM